MTTQPEPQPSDEGVEGLIERLRDTLDNGGIAGLRDTSTIYSGHRIKVGDLRALLAVLSRLSSEVKEAREAHGVLLEAAYEAAVELGPTDSTAERFLIPAILKTDPDEEYAKSSRKRRGPLPTTGEAFGILNPWGDLWTYDHFPNENAARRYLEAYWVAFPGAAPNADRYAIVPVRVTVAALSAPPSAELGATGNDWRRDEHENPASPHSGGEG